MLFARVLILFFFITFLDLRLTENLTLKNYALVVFSVVYTRIYSIQFYRVYSPVRHDETTVGL